MSKVLSLPISPETARIFLSPPHMSGEEIAFVKKAFESNYIAPLGPDVDAFEREFSEVTAIKFALAVSSGTAAMHLALRVLGVRHGDEVFASTLTFIGSVSPILFQYAIPVFIDSDRSTWNMDPDLLRNELLECERRGRLPKAVVPTDLYGQCADLDQIVEICAPYEIPVIVDAAEAAGAKYKGRFAGNGARAAIFSFNGNKIITTSGGGMLVSDDEDLISTARFLSQQAREQTAHYEHCQIGYNYRMSNILAAIGRAQLKVLEARVEKKRQLFKYYKKELQNCAGIEFMPEAPYATANRWLTVVLIHPESFGCDRERVRLALEAQNIESRPIWKPMHLQPVFCSERHGGGVGQAYCSRAVAGEVSEYLFQRGLCLPSGTAMTTQDLDRVIEVIKKCRQ